MRRGAPKSGVATATSTKEARARRPRHPSDGNFYVLLDDFLPERRGPGRPPKITDAELICLAIAQVFLGLSNDRQFLGFAIWRLGDLFPYLPQQPGYNKRLRALAPQITRAINYLAFISPSLFDGLRLLDSTPVPCGASRETVRRSQIFLASPSGTWAGLRLGREGRSVRQLRLRRSASVAAPRPLPTGRLRHIPGGRGRLECEPVLLYERHQATPSLRGERGVSVLHPGLLEVVSFDTHSLSAGPDLPHGVRNVPGLVS